MRDSRALFARFPLLRTPANFLKNELMAGGAPAKMLKKDRLAGGAPAKMA